MMTFPREEDGLGAAAPHPHGVGGVGGIVVGGGAASSGGTPAGIHGGGSSKRARTDAAEWSESAISGLLDAFGARYIASHRGNLRGKDWADVARAVNARGITGAKSVEQCRNKIDNLKKRFKLEREKGSPSVWPWFQTLDNIVGRAPKRAVIPGGGSDGVHRSEHDVKISVMPIEVLDPVPQLTIPLVNVSPPPLLLPDAPEQADDDSDQENVAETPYSSQRDSHTDFPTFKGAAGKDVMSEMTNPSPQTNVAPNRKKRKNVCTAGKDVAASIASFAQVFAKIEFAKMDMFKEVELRRLEMQYKLAKMVHRRKKGRNSTTSSGSDRSN